MPLRRTAITALCVSSVALLSTSCRKPDVVQAADAASKVATPPAPAPAPAPTAAPVAGAVPAPTTNCALGQDVIRKNISHADDAAQYVLYAMMSDNAYIRGDGEAFRLPAGWRFVEDIEIKEPVRGLGFKVFEHAAEGKADQVVVAFRGTEPRDRDDWVQNFALGHRIQNKPAEELFRGVLARYRDQRVRFVATGHSLGGGLALHISFHFPDVSAIVFDSSPVTTPGEKDEREVNSRVNIWQRKEILAFLRPFVRKRWGDTKNISFTFSGHRDNVIKRHAMHTLALNMLGLAMTLKPPPPDVAAAIAANCAPLGTH